MSDEQESKPRVVQELEDLIKQATTENSHYYVKSVCEKSILAIGMLMSETGRIKAENAKIKAALERIYDYGNDADWRREIARECLESLKGGEG